MADPRQEAYNALVEGERTVGAGYDKTLITLSGGALGLTITFAKNSLASGAAVATSFLLFAWASWAISLACLLVAYFFGQWTYRICIDELRRGTPVNDLETPLFKRLTRLVYVLNAVAGLCFIGGVVAVIWFAYVNLEHGHV